MPYEVWAYETNDKEMMTSLMEKLHTIMKLTWY